MVDLIKPSDLAAAATVFPDDAMVVDAGGIVRRATPLQVVDAGAPAASAAIAIAGVNNTLRMTPLRTKQVLDNVTAPSVMRAAAWAESSTPPDPTNLDSKSSKSWAEDAEVAAAAAGLSNSQAAISATEAAGSAVEASNHKDEAEDFAIAAGDSASQSSASAVAASVSRDQAAIYAVSAGTSANFYDTIALGRAAVANGATFGVIAGGSDGLTRPTLYRRNSATTQTEIVKMASGNEVDGKAPLASPVFSGEPTAPNADFTSSNRSQIANMRSLLNWTRGYLSVSVAGHVGGVYTLTEAQALYPVVNLVGALDQDVMVVVPTTTPALSRAFRNGTTGGHALTVMHPSQASLRPIIAPLDIVYTISNGSFILSPITQPDNSSGWPSDEVVAVVGSGVVNVHVPTSVPGGDEYIQYPFVNSINTERGCDVWRWQRGYSALRTGNSTFTVGQQIILNGEQETAIQIAGKTDFMGGLSHGDEKYNSIVMMVDGVVVPMTAGFHRARSIEFIQQSDLFEPDTPVPQSTIAAKAYKRWIFSSSGVKVKQYIVWQGIYNIETSFLGMCAVSRITEGVQVTDSAYRSPLWQYEDVSVAGFPQVSSQSESVSLSGSVYSVQMTVDHGWDRPGRSFYVSNAALYNKLYFDFTGSEVFGPGDTLESSVTYRINKT